MPGCPWLIAISLLDLSVHCEGSFFFFGFVYEPPRYRPEAGESPTLFIRGLMIYLLLDINCIVPPGSRSLTGLIG